MIFHLPPHGHLLKFLSNCCDGGSYTLLRLLNFDLSKSLLIIGIICHLYVSRLVMRVMNGGNRISNQCQLQEQEERPYWNSLSSLLQK